jgi:uncharacterized membrane protein YhaH (DUF805 family)
MRDIVDLLTTFGGRIDRSAWWAGFAIVLVASIAGTLIFHMDFLRGDWNQPPPPSTPDTVWQLAWLVPGTAITVKRFNDRNWPWWLGYAFGAMGAFLLLAPHFGLIIDPDSPGIGKALFWITTAAYLFSLVENGLMRGTKGPNRHGPDPIEASESR